MHRHFQMFAAYNLWANTVLYDAAATLSPEELDRDTGAFFGSMIRTLNHILVADRIWFKRFTGEGAAPASLDEILYPSLPLLRAARQAEDERIVEWVESLSQAVLSGRFTYITITDMRTISQRLAPALAHFFNHQTHHRGQAHAILTTLGKQAPSLDLVNFLRTGEGRPFA